MSRCFLVDNGSLKPSSTRNLRRIASALSTRVGREVTPVSLLHSSKVDPAELDGIPAETLERSIRRALETGEREFYIVPLFFGPSLALTSYLPERMQKLREKHGDFRVSLARTLFDAADGTDLRLVEIVRDRVVDVLPGLKNPAVVLVDHGSPAPEVTYVRNFLAGQLSVLLQGRVSRVVAASMERREGDEYRFNEPLLERVLRLENLRQGDVVVAMLFLSPGRHAGEGGDVWQICRAAEEETGQLKTVMTGLVGDHPDLIPLLAERLTEILGRPEGIVV